MRKGLTSLLLFLICQTAAASELALARQLANERDWRACDTECRRVLLHHPEHATAARALRQQALLHLSRPSRGTLRLRQWGGLPVKGLVAFYRLAIGPALGTRCVLKPSCSAYSLQAARERGWLALPMTGDRLIREPSVVQAKRRPVGVINRRTHFADPISDHIGGAP